MVEPFTMEYSLVVSSPFSCSSTPPKKSRWCCTGMPSWFITAVFIRCNDDVDPISAVNDRPFLAPRSAPPAHIWNVTSIVSIDLSRELMVDIWMRSWGDYSGLLVIGKLWYTPIIYIVHWYSTRKYSSYLLGVIIYHLLMAINVKSFCTILFSLFSLRISICFH